MSGAAVAQIVNDFLNTGISLFNTGYGVYQDQRNSKFSQEQFDYQKALNQQVMEREDTALQRRVADAEAAGISKYAVAGQGASASNMSTFGGSMGSQPVKADKLDFVNHYLQIQEQAARTKLAQAEYDFYKDTVPDRKDKLTFENDAIRASTRRTDSETTGIDVENLIRGRKNLLDAHEFSWLSDGDYANFNKRLAANLLGLEYDTEMKSYNRSMLKRKDFLDFTYGMEERGRDYRAGERAEDLDKMRYNWLMSQGPDGFSNIVKEMLLNQLKLSSGAEKSAKENADYDFNKWKDFGLDVFKVLGSLLMFLK